MGTGVGEEPNYTTARKHGSLQVIRYSLLSILWQCGNQRPPELVQSAPSFTGGIHNGSRALHVLNLKWFWLNRSSIPVGKEGGNFLVQWISTCIPSHRERGGVGTLWLKYESLPWCRGAPCAALPRPPRSGPACPSGPGSATPTYSTKDKAEQTNS